jgi:aminopeptidase N
VAEAAVECAGRAGLREVAMRALARTATTAEDLALLAEHAAGDVELGWLVETRKAELGRYDPDAVARLEQRDPDPDVRSSVLSVRAAVPDRSAKDEVWQAVFADQTVPPDRVLVLGPVFWRPGQEELLAPYVDRYLASLPRLGGGMLSMMAVGRAFFPVISVAPDTQQRIEAAAHDDGLHPILRRTLLEGLDTLRRMLRAREE